MTRFQITPVQADLAIQITGVGERRQELLTTLQACADGHCACPTDEYRKVRTMDVVPDEDAITIRLAAKPGMSLRSSEIERCLDYTVNRPAAGGD